jgi:hypothetical protein
MTIQERKPFTGCGKLIGASLFVIPFENVLGRFEIAGIKGSLELGNDLVCGQIIAYVSAVCI